jgi:hypothetical protein
MDEVRPKKLNNSNELEGGNKKQKGCVLEIENEEKIKEESKDDEEYQIKTRASTKANTKLPRGLRNLDTYYS